MLVKSCIEQRAGSIGGVMAFVLCCSIFFPIGGAIAAEVTPYSWFGSTLELGSTYTGPARYYDGNNVGIEMTARQETNGSRPANSYFTVEPMQKKSLTYSSLGSKRMSRSGFSKVTWQNVGSGTVKFKFSKTTDGCWVYSNDVAMYSW